MAITSSKNIAKDSGANKKDSSPPSAPASASSSSSFSFLKDGKSKDNQKNQPTVSSTANNNNDNTNNKNNETDKHSRFENEGVEVKAKLIGSELVMEPRGDKMCQNSIQRLKAIIKGTNSHKRRILLKISFDGVKVLDEKTNEILHSHEVSQISYIASDDTDTRTFGYVSDVPNKAHQFICFKTSGPAVTVLSTISSLFEAVLERKNRAEGKTEKADDNSEITTSTRAQQELVDLIGDSGIMEGDVSITSDSMYSTPQVKQSNAQIQQTASSILDTIGSPGNSFNSSFNNCNNSISKQQLGSSDLIFDDLFSGVTDPIIVDKNDSLISYKQPGGEQRGASRSSITAPVQSLPQQQPRLALNLSGLSNSFNSSTFVNSSSNASVIMQPLAPLRPTSVAGSQSSLTGAANQSNQLSPTNPLARPIPKRQSQHASGFIPPPSSLPRPGQMTNNAAPGPVIHNRSLVYNHSSVSLSDAVLTRQSSFTSSAQSDSQVDRYAIFNEIDNLPSIFESASLGGSSNNMGPSNTPRPATSAILNPISSASAASPVVSSNPSTGSIFRQTNPFDDDFFA